VKSQLCGGYLDLKSTTENVHRNAVHISTVCLNGKAPEAYFPVYAPEFRATQFCL